MGALVLCYHAVSERWPAALSVTPDALRDQLALLRRQGYRGATFSDVALGRVDGKVVAVTFDDAFSSVGELAKPLLDEVGMPATVFVPTGYVGREGPMAWPGTDNWVGGPHEAELSCMSWDELRALRDAGWEIGSHTRSHPHLTRLSDGDLAEELRSSRADCERELGGCESLAYPYGDYDERVVAAAGAAGYSTACTLPDSMHRARPLAWPRVGVYHADAGLRFRLKLSPAVQRLRGAERLAALARRMTRR
jgi:peptidoglycan/xylan/chitin deacetylase (PgdA/CDA1 family)